MAKQTHILEESNNCSFNGTLNKTRNIVHPKLELKDPSPDIHKLFKRFNRRFFRDKLNRVKLVWRTGMTKTSGHFAMVKDRRGRRSIPTINLSKELLIFRSRKYLIEVLLHEMIHAYLYLEKINRNDAHGLCFIQMARKIDGIIGTNITPYTDTVQEEFFYLKHVWRCNGRCQNEQPFFGWYRAKLNKPPGPSMLWFRKHSKNCAGRFIKQTHAMIEKYLAENERAVPEDLSYKLQHINLYDKSLETKVVELRDSSAYVEPSWLNIVNNNTISSLLVHTIPHMQSDILSSTPIELLPPKLERIDVTESTNNIYESLNERRKQTYHAKAKKRKYHKKTTTMNGNRNAKPTMAGCAAHSGSSTNTDHTDVAIIAKNYSNVQSQIQEMMNNQISLGRQMAELTSQLHVLIQKL